MSRTIDNALEKVQNSRFIWHNDEHTEFEVRDAVIVWPNFRGEPNRFGSVKRCFNLVLNREIANDLVKLGWNVKQIMSKDDNGNPDPEKLMLFINVTAKMDSKYPPTVTLFTEFNGEKNRTSLDEESIGTLDRIDFKTCDMTIGGYQSPTFKGKTTAYLRKLYVIQEPDIEYGGKYDEWMQSDVADEHNFEGDFE